MATRSRTTLFVHHRTIAYPSGGSGGSGRGGGGGGPRYDDDEALLGDGGSSHNEVAIELGTMDQVPIWAILHKEINDKLNAIEREIIELSGLYKKNVRVVFDDDDDQNSRIGMLTEDINHKVGEVQTQIQAITRQASKGGSDEVKTRHNVQVALATRLQTLTQRFKSEQSAHLKKLLGRNANTSALDDMFESGRGEQSFNEEQLAILQNIEDLAAERSREITKIAESIMDLAAIFRDMQILVIEQGTIIDRIDYNIEMVVENTSTAHEELIQANRSQKKARTKLCIILLVTVVIALILLLAFKPKSQNEN